MTADKEMNAYQATADSVGEKLSKLYQNLDENERRVFMSIVEHGGGIAGEGVAKAVATPIKIKTERAVNLMGLVTCW